MELKAHSLRKKNRNSAIELCRILAILMIIGCHFSTHGGFSFGSDITLPRMWTSFLRMGGLLGVDVYVLISGYFLIRNDRFSLDKKKCIRFWGQVFFYSVCLFIIAVITGRSDISIKGVVRALFPLTFSSWWFASTYFVMFLLHPFINILLRSFNQKQYQRYLLILFIIWVIISTFTTSSFEKNALIDFVLLYSVGGYIGLYGLNPKLKSKHFCFLWLLFTGITYLSCVALVVLGKKIPAFAGREHYFYRDTMLPTFFSAICFFMIFERMNMPNRRFINTLSSATFGVYLLHDSKVLRPILWKELFMNASFQNTAWIIPYSLAVIIIVFSACTVIDLIRQFIFAKTDVYFFAALDQLSGKFKPKIRAAMKWLSENVFGTNE